MMSACEKNCAKRLRSFVTSKCLPACSEIYVISSALRPCTPFEDKNEEWMSHNEYIAIKDVVVQVNFASSFQGYFYQAQADKTILCRYPATGRLTQKVAWSGYETNRGLLPWTPAKDNFFCALLLETSTAANICL